MYISKLWINDSSDTTFKYEIKKKDILVDNKETMLLDYHDYKISIQDGDFIRLALILSSEASETLKLAQKNFIKQK